MKRVLIADDSSFMRKALTHLLESDENIEVVDTAVDGAEAVRKVGRLRPDVVILDMEMAGMGGLVALTHIMAECPTPVLVLSGLAKSDATLAIKCLEHGAVDFIPKPSGVISYDIDGLRSDIIAKVKWAAGVSVHKLDLRLSREPLRPRRPEKRDREKVVVIGASTGGQRALATILPALPRGLPASILIVQHMSPEFVASFADRLRWECCIDVEVACQGMPLQPGRAVIAPSGWHTLIEPTRAGKRIRLLEELAPQGISPSVNCAMESAAATFGPSAIGVLLTGVGSDGASGMKSIKDRGGCTIAEDSSTCLVFGMPKAAIDLGCVDQVVPLPQMAQAILDLI